MAGKMPESANKLVAAIREVLWTIWDPIGVNTCPEAQDEYDMYAPELCQRLLQAATTDELVRHLKEIETQRMGLSSRPDSELLSTVEALERLVAH
jgi:hypothetical protein